MNDAVRRYTVDYKRVPGINVITSGRVQNKIKLGTQ